MWKRSIGTLFSRIPSSFTEGKNVAISSIANNVAKEKFGVENISSIMSLSELKKMLESCKCLFEDGFTCLKTTCLHCQKISNGNIYINKTTGLFLCMDCQEMGDWNCFESRIKSPGVKSVEIRLSKACKNKPEVIEDFSDRWNELESKFPKLADFPDKERKDILLSFKLPTRTDLKTINYLSILYSSENSLLYFPLTNGTKRIVGIMKLDKNGCETSIPFKKCAGILRVIPNRITKKCDQAIIVHKIEYLLALATYKLNYHIICLPHGTSALPQELLPVLEQYVRVVLWFGTNKYDLTAAKAFAKKLKEERCFLVREDSNDAILSKENVNASKMLLCAQKMVPENVITFADLKDEIYSDLINADQHEGIKWKRFPVLNEILRGHRRGEVTILTGPTGAGKTTFLSEYSLDLALQGVPTLWGSFEIRNQRLLRTMLQQFAIEPLLSNLNKFEELSRDFEKLPLYFLKFHGQQPIEAVMKVVEHATYVHDIQHLVIDNLQFMIGSAVVEETSSNRFFQQDLVIASLRSFATYSDCHVTLVIHPRKEKDYEDLLMSSIFGGAKASQEADNVLIIQKKLTESLQVKKYLQVVKNRFSGDLGSMPLVINKSSLSFWNRQTKE